MSFHKNDIFSADIFKTELQGDNVNVDMTSLLLLVNREAKMFSVCSNTRGFKATKIVLSKSY